MWQTGGHTGVSISNVQEAHPAKTQASRGPSSGLRSLSSHFSSRLWSSARCGPRPSVEHHSAVRYSAVPHRAPRTSIQLGSAQLSSASVLCSPVLQCSAVRGCLSVTALQVGWLLLATSLSTCAYFVARFQVLPGLVSGVSHAGSSTFAAPWHWNATLRLHNCNLILPARLVPVNCIVATHARHFVCIDPTPYALPWPHTRPDTTPQERIGDHRQTARPRESSQGTQTQAQTRTHSTHPHTHTHTHTPFRAIVAHPPRDAAHTSLSTAEPLRVARVDQLGPRPKSNSTGSPVVWHPSVLVLGWRRAVPDS